MALGDYVAMNRADERSFWNTVCFLELPGVIKSPKGTVKDDFDKMYREDNFLRSI